MSVASVFIGIIALLIAALCAYIGIGGAAKRRKERKRRQERRRYERNRARINAEMEARKERMETGNSRVDFNNSIDVLSELAGTNKRNRPPDSSQSNSKR